MHGWSFQNATSVATKLRARPPQRVPVHAFLATQLKGCFWVNPQVTTPEHSFPQFLDFTFMLLRKSNNTPRHRLVDARVYMHTCWLLHTCHGMWTDWMQVCQAHARMEPHECLFTNNSWPQWYYLTAQHSEWMNMAVPCDSCFVVILTSGVRTKRCPVNIKSKPKGQQL